MRIVRILISALLSLVLVVVPVTPMAMRAACATACPEMKARAEAARKPACCMARPAPAVQRPSCCGHDAGPGLSVHCTMKPRHSGNQTLAAPVPSKVTVTHATQGCPVTIASYAEILRSDRPVLTPEHHPPDDHGESITLRFCTLLC